MPFTARRRAFSQQALKRLEEASSNLRAPKVNSLTSRSLCLHGQSYLLPTLILPKLNGKDGQDVQPHFHIRASTRPTPVVLDLHQVSSNGSPHSHSIKKHELRNQISQLQKAGYVAVGISNASEDVKKLAADLDLPYFIGTRLQPEQGTGDIAGVEEEELLTSASGAATPFVKKEDSVSLQSADDPLPPMVVSQLVRSGQQIYAQNRSLVVLGNVSSGAEVMADEDVVVLGGLKGRALAGIGGNVRARIICQSFDAELISIAHCFTTCDDLEQNETGSLQLHKPVVISLKDNQLFFESSMM